MAGPTQPGLEAPRLRFLTIGRPGGSFAQNWGELDLVHSPNSALPPCLSLLPACPPTRLGLLDSIRYHSNLAVTIMRQAGVSRVTFHGPNVWKSPNQNDPTDKLESRFPKWPLQLPREENSRPQPLPIFADRITQAQRSPKQACPAFSKGGTRLPRNCTRQARDQWRGA